MRQVRDQQEEDILKIASQAQEGNLSWTQENLTQIQNEDKLVVQRTQDLKEFMNSRLQENV